MQVADGRGKVYNERGKSRTQKRMYQILSVDEKSKGE